MADEIIHIDGSTGGGQIVRTALALSTILKKPFHITGIRKGRKQPGLKSQHLHAIKALEELCGAKTEGAALGSTELSFYPGELKPRTLSIDIGTAGSITLLLQSLLLPALLGGGKYRFKIKGGTDVAWSPQIDYFTEIIIPQLRRFAEIDVKRERRGYFPKGSGQVDLMIKGRFTIDSKYDAPSVDLSEQGILMHVKGVSHASVDLQAAQVAERQAHAAKVALRGLDCPVNIEVEYANTLSTGSGITCWAIFSKDREDIDILNPLRLGADVLGERGKRAEIVGQEAAAELIRLIRAGSPVDEHLADNLVPFIAVFGGSINVTDITDHSLANASVCESFLGTCLVLDKENKTIKNV